LITHYTKYQVLNESTFWINAFHYSIHGSLVRPCYHADAFSQMTAILGKMKFLKSVLLSRGRLIFMRYIPVFSENAVAR
jgi:hypothetical protein